jgi:tetratricopeptide (TPR) repeat protein
MAGGRCFVIVTLMLGAAAGARAQTTPTRAVAEGHGPAAVRAGADSLYYAGRPAESLALLRAHLTAFPADADALWRAARAALATGWVEPNESASIQSYLEAEQFARGAIRAAPQRTEGHYVLAAALGRRALIAKTPRAAATLANQVHREATALLALDARHAGAHSILGQLHAETMRKPWAVRVVGLRLGGGVEFKPSWTAAERELRTAIDVEPEMMLHRFELARAYTDMKRASLAKPLLEQVVTMPIVHPMDRLMQQQARHMLDTHK